jgi:acyl-CoA synthetase
MQDFAPSIAPIELRRRWEEEGLWTDDTFPVVAARGLASNRSARARVLSAVRPYDGTVGDLADQGARLAGLLSAGGIGPGEVVAFQLPNWPEAVSTFYGLLQLGVVVVPIVHIYGHKEIGHILRQSAARALITADRFGSHDYLAELDLAPSLADLELIVVVDAHGSFPTPEAESLTWNQVLAAGEPLGRVAVVDPDAPALICYTSGTTSAAKGVVHTHRTFLAELRQGAALRGRDPASDANDPLGGITGAPVGHVAGMLSMFGPMVGSSMLHLLDRWDPGLVLRTMREDRLTSGSGATFFLTSLLDHPDFDPAVHAPLMARIGMGGAPIPAEVARRADALGISITRSYGSTEHPSITSTTHADPAEIRLYTDGAPLPGVEIRLVDDDARDVPRGTPGEILSRGPDRFVGYVDPALTATCIDREGWFATGDIGVLDERGNLSITDRKKDIIIRGGENISAAEVEDLMLTIPGVLEVAVVAAPDPRYGEHACAFVQLDESARPFGLEELRRHLDRAGLARQKWPEEQRFVVDFPRTPSGKIQKHALRERLRSESSGLTTDQVSTSRDHSTS